ncbi:MAG TPA: hypothetical protein VH370_11595 [Humisphaera sp.]|nr:hypothetical protein [Humisphaera sp.]
MTVTVSTPASGLSVKVLPTPVKLISGLAPARVTVPAVALVGA